MRYIRICVVMISVISAACFLSFLAKEKYSKSEKALEEKLHSDAWKKEFVEKTSKHAPVWMLQQIAKDLSPFAYSGITSEMLNETLKQSDKNWELVGVSIRNNQIAFSDPGQIKQIRLDAMKETLTTMAALVPLPDMDFILCLGDALDGADVSAPVLAFAKHKDSHKIILIPDMDVLSTQIGQLLYKIERGIKKYPWNKKISKAFWRGATTGSLFDKDTFLSLPRSQAVTCSLENPHLVDARFTHLVQCASPQEVQEEFSSYFTKSLSVKEHLKFKYQLLIDGNTCAYSRAYWQLFSNCAILKQSSPNIQWFYSLLKPYVHYIPLKNDLTDLEEKILWTKDHDKEVRKIIHNAQALARDNLRQADVYYYLYLVLVEYAKLQKASNL